MKKITNILGMKILNIYDSKVEGVVKNVLFDKYFKKIKWFLFFNDGEISLDKILNVNEVYNYGEDAIVIKNDENVNLESEVILSGEKMCPINCDVYTTKGKFMGKINDIVIDDNNNVISVVLDKNFEIKREEILTLSESTLIVQDNSQPVKLSSFKKRSVPTSKTNTKVVILNEPEMSTIEGNNTMPSPITERESVKLKYIFNENSLPTRITADNQRFLIGRKVEKNIYAENKEIIAKKNTRITEKILESAIINSKLRELTMFSK